MFQAWNFSEWRGRNAGIFGAIFDLLPLAVFDRPVLELGRFAIDPLQGNFRGNSDIFVWPGALSRSWSIKIMYHFCLGAVHLKARARQRMERPFAIFIATTISHRAVGALFLWRLSFG